MRRKRKIKTTIALKSELKITEGQYKGWTADEIRAYRHWIYMKKKKDERLGIKDKSLSETNHRKIDKDYRFYWRYFRKNGLEYVWEKRYNKLLNNAIYSSKKFALFVNRLVKVVNKYGTLDEKEAIKSKYNSSFISDDVMGK